MGVISGLKYVSDELKENYRDKEWWKGRLTHRVLPHIHQIYPGKRDCINVMHEDWDNLIVLDACRADLFEEVETSSNYDEYRSVVSNASMTGEWVEETFSGQEFGDTVYVTGNPQVSVRTNGSFHSLYEVWKTGFDDQLLTIPPDPVTETAREAIERHPNKRLIVHYMQPHQPFIGEHQIEYPGGVHIGGHLDNDWEGKPTSPWEAAERGLVSKNEVQKAYKSNLEFILETIQEFVEEIPGRTVITSDHGNCLGEWAVPLPYRLWAHPAGVRLPALTHVPWAVLDGSRREIEDDGVNTTPKSSDSSEKAMDQLKALGYR